MRESLRTIPMEQPGLMDVFHFINKLSIFLVTESGNVWADILLMVRSENKMMGIILLRLILIKVCFELDAITGK